MGVRRIAWDRLASIRGRLVLLAIAVAVPLSAGVIYSLIAARAQTIESERESAARLAGLAAANLDAFIADSRMLMNGIAARPRVRAATVGQCDPFLREIPAIHPEYANMGVIDLSGRVICSALAQPSGQFADVSDSDWFRTVKRSQRFVVGEPFVGPITGRWVSVLAEPLRSKDGTLTGYLALPVDLVLYRRTFVSLNLSEGAFLAIVADSGVVVARSLEPERYVGTNVTASEAFGATGGRRSGSFEADTVDGVHSLWGFHRSEVAEWTVYAAIPTSVALADSHRLIETMAFALVLSLVLAGLAAGAASSGIAGPIRQLARKAEAIGVGDLDERADVAGPTEVAAAARRFNEMIDARLAAVAEQRRLAGQLAQSQKLEAIGSLAGGIAHDFNNLLQVIGGYGQLALVQAGDDPELRESLDQVVRAADRASELTHQLLAFSRGHVVELAPLELSGLVRETSTLLGRVLGEDIAIVERLPEQAAWVVADEGQLSQVLLNLAVNARDAMPEGGTFSIGIDHVVVETAEALNSAVEPGRYVRLRVSDTGGGMSEDVREHIFDPFFTTKDVGRGTGLGLSTVYGIVAQCGGVIRVESEPDHGTTFTMLLPAGEPQLPGEAPSSTATPRGRGELVLVVEDEEIVLGFVSESLRRFGYRVIEATGARSALALPATERPDLVLTDVVMPDRHGPDLVQELRERWPGLKAIFMSGFVGHAVVEQRLLSGEALLEKPFSAEDLAQAVRARLDETAGA